ncbi:MAG TPA: hypothetical protein VFW40_03820 [Capsulimonadaceae bacterium]|nr:hypothetical protein [Capsulimonadaceae bacterium]
MDIKHALKEQYHAALAMLANCVERCSDDLWTSGAPSRAVWQIALHGAYFTHLYLGQNLDSYQPWPDLPAEYEAVWKQEEPFHFPTDITPLSRRQTLDYIAYVDSLLDPTIDRLDLDSPETGIPWYKNMTKLSHELLNLRHTQGHVGQLSEILMSHGIDTDWISKTT